MNRRHVSGRRIRACITAGVLTLWLAFGTTAQAAVPKVIRAATDATFPPMEFVKDDKLTGFDIALTEALAKQMGSRIRWINTDFKGLIPGLVARRFDIANSAIYITPARLKVVDFTRPYYTGGLVALVRNGTPIKTPDDLKGKRVSVQVGTKSVDYLRSHYPTVQRVEVEKNEQMFDLMQIGRVDAAVTGKPAARYYAQKVSGVHVVPQQLTQERYGIAVRKDLPELTAALNKALAQIKANGVYDRLVAKWFGAE